MMPTPSPRGSESLRLVTFQSPFSSFGAPSPRTEDPPQPRRGQVNPWLRMCLGTVMPLIMITLGMSVQRNARLGEPEELHARPVETPANLPQRLLNAHLLNRSCGARLMVHYTLESSSGGSGGSGGGGGSGSGGSGGSSGGSGGGGSSKGAAAKAGSAGLLPSTSVQAVTGEAGARIVVGAGFLASGLTSLSSIFERLPGGCHPIRPNLGFWTSLPAGAAGAAASKRSSAIDVGDDDGHDGHDGHETVEGTWHMPRESGTRHRYLNEYVRLRRGVHGAGGCTIPWELTERYVSVTSRHYSPPVRRPPEPASPE